MAKKKPLKKKTVKTARTYSEHEEDYFVSAKNPAELRRQLLESTKKSVLSMQNFERLQIVREKKLQELSNLRQSIKELIYLNKKFNEKLPRYDKVLLQDMKNVSEEVKQTVKSASSELKAEDVKKEVKLKKVSAPEKVLAREKTDMEKLEDSLAAIEKKLQSIQN